MNHDMSFRIKSPLKGFSLLETLASIGILAFVVIGPLAVIVNSSSYARQTKDIMVATYLAEEALELVQNQYDSLFIHCQKNLTDPFCTLYPEELTFAQAVWRQFKTRFSAISGQPSCYSSKNNLEDNPLGCSYDYRSLLVVATNTVPVRYLPNDTECPYVVEVSTTTPVDYKAYVCKADAETFAGDDGEIGNRYFSRSLIMEQMPTFETGDYDVQYNDDVKLTSVVQFRGINGLPQTIKVVRFIHALP